jgi:hypothetical protein
MTEEAREQSFAQYMAATKAIDWIKRRKSAEGDESFATTPSSTAAWATKFVTLRTSVTPGGRTATQQPPTTEDESVEEIIWRVGTSLVVGDRVALASRLNELQKAVQEEEPDGRGINPRSMQQFIALLKANPALHCPIVSVTPDQNIYASWKSGPDRVFSIHFLPDGSVRFVIFCPNDRHPDQSVRLSGTATVDVIISIASRHGVLDWATK